MNATCRVLADKVTDGPWEIFQKILKKRRAYGIYSPATKYGLIKREHKCSKCGKETRVVGHHESYDKPLEVIWLCFSCHARRHQPRIFITIPRGTYDEIMLCVKRVLNDESKERDIERERIKSLEEFRSKRLEREAVKRKTKSKCVYAANPL